MAEEWDIVDPQRAQFRKVELQALSRREGGRAEGERAAGENINSQERQLTESGASRFAKPQAAGSDGEAATTENSPADAPPSIAQRLVEGQVIEALRAIYDPEIPVNIYDLGLIYEIKVDVEMNVKVKMTLTAPACPVAGSLPGEVERRIESIDAVKSADVELVWEPPWSKDRMSEAAQLELGMF